MSEQFMQGDRKIEKVGPGRYHVHVYDGTKFVDRWHMDEEGVSNLLDEIHSGKTDLSPRPIGTDQYGNSIYRLKKNI
jgi:hypothetical protein